jgi:hypothetical protein
MRRNVIFGLLLCLSAIVISESQGGLSTSQPSPVNITQVGSSAIGTATTGVAKVGVVGGTGTSLETTAGVLDHNIKNIGNSAVSTAASGVQKVGVVGNAGAAVDAATNAAAPANVLWHVLAPSTATGVAPTMSFINATGAAASIKASAGNLYGFCLTNETSSVEYAEFFNTASTPTLGTTAVVFAVKMPASANVCPGTLSMPMHAFSSGIGFASVTTENGSTTASITGALFYQ